MRLRFQFEFGMPRIQSVILSALDIMSTYTYLDKRGLVLFEGVKFSAKACQNLCELNAPTSERVYYYPRSIISPGQVN